MSPSEVDAASRPAPAPQPKTSALLSARVLMEACPPSREDRDKAYAVLRQSFSCYNSFHAVSVPDLQDNAEFQRDKDRIPNHEFAAYVRGLTDKPLSLYKVSTSCTAAEFEAWLHVADELGCADLFLVGGDSSRRPIAAGALALEDAAALASSRGFRCGGIIIPTRRRQFAPRPASVDENDRLVSKLRGCGFAFFSTQILYEGEWMCCLLLDLVRTVPVDELPKVFLTFSPFVCTDDLVFAKRTLGVYVPNDVDRMLKGARSMREASIGFLIQVWDRISAFATEIGFPTEKLGVNLEYLDSRNPRNVDAAFELAEEFGRLFRRR
jgi:hypothetical protein